MRALCFASATLACALLASAPVHADAPSDADAALQHGVELRKEGKDEDALAEFQRAFALSPSPRARAQIGLAELALGRWVEAEKDLEDALRAKDDPWIVRYVGELQKSLEIARPHLAWLEVDANVAGAELELNGTRVAALPMAGAARVVAGSVVVGVRAPGYLPVTRPIEVAPGAKMRESVTLVREAAPSTTPLPAPEASSPAPAPAGDSGAGLRVAGFVTTGIAVVGLGLGGWFGLETFVAKADRDPHCTAAGCDPTGLARDSDARRDATISTIGFGVGLASAAAAAFLFFRASRSSVVVAPAVGATGATASFVGTF